MGAGTKGYWPCSSGWQGRTSRGSWVFPVCGTQPWGSESSTPLSFPPHPRWACRRSSIVPHIVLKRNTHDSNLNPTNETPCPHCIGTRTLLMSRQKSTSNIWFASNNYLINMTLTIAKQLNSRDLIDTGTVFFRKTTTILKRFDTVLVVSQMS